MKKAHRTSAVRIRVTADERAAIAEAGLKRGLGLCSFSRMAVVTAAGLQAAASPRRKATGDAVALARWTAQLAVIGNLLNQLARTHHLGFDTDPVDVAAVRDELVKLRETVLSTQVDRDGP
jgi:hypothetical protein